MSDLDKFRDKRRNLNFGLPRLGARLAERFRKLERKFRRAQTQAAVCTTAATSRNQIRGRVPVTHFKSISRGSRNIYECAPPPLGDLFISPAPDAFYPRVVPHRPRFARNLSLNAGTPERFTRLRSFERVYDSVISRRSGYGGRLRFPFVTRHRAKTPGNMSSRGCFSPTLRAPGIGQLFTSARSISSKATETCLSRILYLELLTLMRKIYSARFLRERRRADVSCDFRAETLGRVDRGAAASTGLGG